MNELPKIFLAKFRNHSAHIWMVDQGLGSGKDFRNQAPPNLWGRLTLIPSLNSLKIPNGRFCERDG